MNVAVFSTRKYDRRFLIEANQERLNLTFFEIRLELESCSLAEGYPAVCVFVNDQLNADVLHRLYEGGTRMIALRCTGFNNLDFYAIQTLGFTVARVPVYSPSSISEYTIGLILALARKICKAYLKTREGNFSLSGLLGYNIRHKTAGIIGTGRIGAQTALGLAGLGCRVLVQDVQENSRLVAAGIPYVSRETLFQESDIISLHCPLLPETFHLINHETIQVMKDGVMIVNTSRGGLVDTGAVIDGLKSGKIGSLALDVYEEEDEFFFEDFSDRVILDDQLARILNFPNVIVTGHQAFFTTEAMRAIARQTIENLLDFENGTVPAGILTREMIVAP